MRDLITVGAEPRDVLRGLRATLDGADLIRFCEGRLSYFAIPRFVDFVSELPRTESGKVQRFVLRQKAAAG